jgi:hypothetical protein
MERRVTGVIPAKIPKRGLTGDLEGYFRENLRDLKSRLTSPI